MTTVIVPAHNEGAVIGRTLSALLDHAEPGEFDIIVVCNGCTDDTAMQARTHDGVQVVEIDAASKVAALNRGDAAATTFPRIYLDADISLSIESLRALARALTDGALAAAPVPVIDVTGCGLIPRAYYAIWSRLGYATNHILGAGVYALSEAGRQRFAEFPDVIADDGFVYCLFEDDERINPPGATFTLQAPRTARALIRRRIRIVAGNVELSATLDLRRAAPPPGWKAVVKNDRRLWPAAPIYVAVNVVAALAARRRARMGTRGNWYQDRTTRGEAG